MPELLSKDGLINSLNEDLKLEYSAALQYVQHASVMQGAEFDHIRTHLLEHADEEFDHAKTLSDRIAFLGGSPVACPDLTTIKLSEDNRYMLALDLSGERTAIARYKDRIEQANALREYGLAQVLSEILKAEEEHENDLVTTLGGGLSPDKTEAVGMIIRLANMEQSRKSRLL